MALFWRALPLAFVALAGCSRTLRREPPPLPQLAFDRFLPAMREPVEEAYKEAAANPNDARLNGKLGMVLHAYDQFEAAAVCYERARALDSKSFEWPYYLGLVQAATGRNAEAAAALRDALRVDPDYLPARIKLADALLGMGELRESREMYEAIAKKHPQFAAAHYGLGRVRAAEGDFASAVDHYRTACELSPGFGAAHYALALAYRRLGENAKAEEHMAVYQRDPLGGAAAEDAKLDAVRALNTGAQHHLKKGVGLEAAGKLDESVAEHELAVKIDPKLVQAHVNLITLYGKLGKPDKAAEHYKAAIDLNANQADMHYNFGVMLYGQRRQKEAAAAFRKALEVNPKYSDAHNNLGYILESEGKLDEAMSHYRAALENDPNYRLAHFHLGRLLVHKRRNAEAIEHFLHTLTPEDENTAGYMYALAIAYARAGNRQSALRYARQARDRAASHGQTQLVASIERDLRVLEGRQ